MSASRGSGRIPLLELDDGTCLAESNLARFGAVRAWLDRVREQPGHLPITQG